jgi:xanthine/uracil/vitamin C permease (AzgA family)
VTLGDIDNLDRKPWCTGGFAALIVAGALLALRVKGALLIGIIVGTAVLVFHLVLQNYPETFNLTASFYCTHFYEI